MQQMTSQKLSTGKRGEDGEREERQPEVRNENQSKSVFSLLVLVLAFIVYSNLVETKKKQNDLPISVGDTCLFV